MPIGDQYHYTSWRGVITLVRRAYYSLINFIVDILGLIIVLTMIGVADSAISAPLIVKIEDQILYISGPMDKPMVAAVQRVHWDRIREIRFTSFGGWSGPALEIAKAFETSGKPIILSDVCASACLDILVLKMASLNPNTLVFLHNTPIAQYYAVRKNYPKLGSFLKGYGDNEVAWLVQHGVDPRILLISYAETGPTCTYVVKDENSEAAAEHLITAVRYQLWAPSASTLERLGVHLHGAPLQDAETQKNELGRRFPKADLKLVRADDGSLSSQLPPFQVLATMLGEIPVCLPSSLHGLPAYGSKH